MIPVIGEISRFQSQPTAKALDIELNRWTSPVDSEATEKHIVPSDTISDHPFKKLTLIFFTYWIFVVVPKSVKGREFAKSDCNPVGQEQSKSCSHTPVDRKFIPSYTRFVHPYIKKWKGEKMERWHSFNKPQALLLLMRVTLFGTCFSPLWIPHKIWIPDEWLHAA